MSGAYEPLEKVAYGARDKRTLDKQHARPPTRAQGAQGAAITQCVGLRDIVGFRPGVDDATTPLVASAEFIEDSPAVSPDGRWLAYASNETGRLEVYVRPFPDVDSTRVASLDGRWRRSGHPHQMIPAYSSKYLVAGVITKDVRRQPFVLRCRPSVCPLSDEVSE